MGRGSRPSRRSGSIYLAHWKAEPTVAARCGWMDGRLSRLCLLRMEFPPPRTSAAKLRICTSTIDAEWCAAVPLPLPLFPHRHRRLSSGAPPPRRSSPQSAV
ncbi:hypothetical protein L1887_62641 [Cichorium endivia]|nr:hypothetical protein L1887_62641 [Cichorium endivia]